jgi:hypothetical protein
MSKIMERRKNSLRLHAAETQTLACGFFPAKARAIEGKVILLTRQISNFNGTFCASAIAQD